MESLELSSFKLYELSKFDSYWNPLKCPFFSNTFFLDVIHKIGVTMHSDAKTRFFGHCFVLS